MGIFITLSIALAEPPPPPIVYGELASGFPETVSLAGGSGAYRYNICTGTLITPQLVLTAAHCLAVNERWLFEETRILIGDDITQPDEEIAFDTIWLHPEYRPDDSNAANTDFDLALLRLEAPASVPTARIRLEPLVEDEIPFYPLMIVGFGQDEDGHSAGRKRSAAVTSDKLDEMYVISRLLSNPEHAGTCSGDSGGPLFDVDAFGRPTVWGVHSWAFADCTHQFGSTRVDIAADWIRERITAAHGTDDLCVAAGRYGDGVCDADLCPGDWECRADFADQFYETPPHTPTPPSTGCATAPAAGILALGPLLLGLPRRLYSAHARTPVAGLRPRPNRPV